MMPTGQPSMRASAVISERPDQRPQLEERRRRRPAGRSTGACRSPGAGSRAPGRSARDRAPCASPAARTGRRRPGVGREVATASGGRVVGLVVGRRRPRSICPVMRAWTSTPPRSSKEITSPVATSNTRGDVTARHVPRTWTTKSEWPEEREPPNESPTMIVAIGHPATAQAERRLGVRPSRSPRCRACRGCGRHRSGRSARWGCRRRAPARRAARPCGRRPS